MERSEVLSALDGEIGALVTGLGELTEDEAVRPTRCAPWDVAALTVHTGASIGHLGPMLDGVAPVRAEVSALGYYTPEVRFAEHVDRDRVDSALRGAAQRSDPGEPVRMLEAAWLELLPRAAEAPPGRTVLTRHRDAMLLDDYLLTRVVEVVLHGLDLADALDRGPWTTGAALAAVGALVFGGPFPAGAEAPLPLEAVRAATGRTLPGGPGPEALAGARVNRIALS